MLCVPASLILGMVGLFTDREKFPAIATVVISGGLVLLALTSISGSILCG